MQRQKHVIWRDILRNTQERSLTDVFNVTNCFPNQHIWDCIWNHTPETSRTSAINANLHLFVQMFWRHTWQHTMDKNHINAAYVTMRLFRQANWRHIWKPTLEKNRTNVTSVTFSPPTLVHWKKHIENHKGEKQNQCDSCNYASSHVADLNKHLKKHTQVHLKKHMGERPNKCNQCNYASLSPSYLRSHLKIHTGEKQMRPLWIWKYSCIRYTTKGNPTPSQLVATGSQSSSSHPNSDWRIILLLSYQGINLGNVLSLNVTSREMGLDDSLAPLRHCFNQLELKQIDL